MSEIRLISSDDSIQDSIGDATIYIFHSTMVHSTMVYIFVYFVLVKYV